MGCCAWNLKKNVIEAGALGPGSTSFSVLLSGLDLHGIHRWVEVLATICASDLFSSPDIEGPPCRGFSGATLDTVAARCTKKERTHLQTVGLLPGRPRSAQTGSHLVDVRAFLLCCPPNIPFLVWGWPAQCWAGGCHSVVRAPFGCEWSSQNLDHVLSGALADCSLTGLEEWASLFVSRLGSVG